MNLSDTRVQNADQQRRVVIAGGSGFLGVSLAHYLSQHGFCVVILSRKVPPAPGPWSFVQWDGRTLSGWSRALEQCNAVINLAGRSVDCIKTPDHCDEILRSRVESTRLLGLAMKTLDRPPMVWVQMSTAHIYGDPPTEVCTEESAEGYGLAPDVGRAWEKEFHNAVQPTQRGVVLRTGFVVGRDRGAGGGALSRLSLLARIGLGGKVGTGRQGMSWIHELDMNRIFRRAIDDSTMKGVYIASSPSPVPQIEFMRAIRQQLRVPFGLPATELMVRFGAHWLLRTDPELALYGRYVSPQKLLGEGFTFRYPDLAEALQELL